MNSTRNTVKKPTHEQISLRAAQLWKKEGCRSGCDWKYWLQAEKELGAPARPAIPQAFLKIACVVTKRLLKSPPNLPRA